MVNLSQEIILVSGLLLVFRLLFLLFKVMNMFFLWCFGIFDQNMVENEFFLIRNITTSTFHRPEVVGIWAGQATRRLFFSKNQEANDKSFVS